MEVMYIMMPIAIGFAIAFLAAFRWANNQGQFDDLETPKHRMLLDDEKGFRKERG